MERREHKTTSAKAILALVVSVVCLGVASSTHAAYDPGFIWDRSVDWGTGSPPADTLKDSEGNQAWRYEYVNGEGLAGITDPWYENIGSTMTPDTAWFGTPDYLLWGRGDDILPCMDAVQLYQLVNDTYAGLHGVWTDIPVVRWLNPTGETIGLTVTGTLTVGWRKIDLASLPVEVAIARVNLTSGASTLLYSATVDNPAGSLSVNIPTVVMGPDDSLVITPRVTRAAEILDGTPYIAMRDDLVLIRNEWEIPEPAIMALLAMGGLAALRRRRRRVC